MVRYRTLIIALAVIAAAGTAGAQTLIVRPPVRPPIPPHPPGVVFTLESQHVRVDVDRQVAVTTIEQRFRNRSGAVQEGQYIFPVPSGAAVSRFTMWMNGEEVEGEVVEARRARQIYEDIVRRMRDPGLLEFVGQGLFRARVFPIPARGEVDVKISYEQVLEYDAGAVCYRFPMRAAGVCAGGGIGELSLALDIRSDVPIRSLYSPTHEIDARVRGRRASAGFEVRDARRQRDFVLYYTVSEDDVGLNLLTHRVRGEDGYFVMLVSPGGERDDDRILDKDVVFVLDTSGSMKGEKIEQARAALEYCIERLRGGDRFNVIAFATSVNPFEERLVPATRENRRRALQYVDRLRARGGTDIDAALAAALDLPRSRRPRMVVFLTDGLPTVGETDARRILVHAQRDNVAGARVFPFGVGYDVNTMLLDRLSEEHRGAVDYIRPEENIEDRISRFYDKVQSPVLSDIAVDFGGADVYDVYPRELPDLFDGSQLVVVGRYRGGGPTAVALTGHVGDEERSYAYDADFPRRTGGSRAHAYIPRLWASRKIAYLLSEIKMNGADRELVDSVIELSLEHGIVTPYTSYLILEEGSDADRRRLSSLAPPAREDARNEEMRKLVSSFAMPRSERKKMDASTEARLMSGSAATEVSRELGRERDARIVREDDEGVRVIDGTRFVLIDGVWTDSRVQSDMDATDIAFLSDDYFALLDNHPELREVLALGERVTFVLDNHCYRITS